MKLEEKGLLLGQTQNEALEFLDLHFILECNELIFDLVISTLCLSLQAVDADGVNDITGVGLAVMLLHFGDAEVMDGHERDNFFVGLF